MVPPLCYAAPPLVDNVSCEHLVVSSHSEVSCNAVQGSALVRAIRWIVNNWLADGRRAVPGSNLGTGTKRT